MTSEHVMGYGDPQAEEAVRLLLRAASASSPGVAGPELTRLKAELMADERLLAWFIYVAGLTTMIHAREKLDDYDGDPNDELLAFEEALIFALRGGVIEEDD